MEKKKLNLTQLKVQSFVTDLNRGEQHRLNGGATYKCPSDYLICDTYAECTYTEDLMCTARCESYYQSDCTDCT